MGINLPTELGLTEGTVKALMSHLVVPLLPSEHNDVVGETPSESQQKSVAKHVHAAVVLYNYYHLKQNPEKEVLNFHQFCDLAIRFVPGLQHMGYMTVRKHKRKRKRKRKCRNLKDPENHFTIIEKAILDACTISETLRASSNMIKGWPVTKVAVFLIDSKKENCFLQYDNGLLSVIEKDLYSEESGLGVESKKVSLMGNYDEEGAYRLKVAFSAVEEVAGVDRNLIKVLEDHVVYSQSQARAATHFYIVQSTKSIRKEESMPIGLAISCSLVGPIAMKWSDIWYHTRAVEYYDLLPYAEILSKWFNR